MADITVSELKAQHDLLRTDPQAYVDLLTGLIQADASNSSNYFSRHYGWLRLNRPDLAIVDLDRAIALQQHPIHFLSRGTILSDLGRHEEALADFARGEALDPDLWRNASGPLQQATSLAALGKEKAALAACDRLNEDESSPGLSGAPMGNKAEITQEIRRRARAAAGSRR